MLHEPAETGNTVVVVEHNLEAIKTTDWIVDLGPEGGTQASLRSLATPCVLPFALKQFREDKLPPLLQPGNLLLNSFPNCVRKAGIAQIV